MVSFSEIMTRGIMYFDAEYREECEAFCRLRYIQYLPHINDPRLCFLYDRKKRDFREQEIQASQVVHADHHIFNPDIVAAFKEYDVLFVQRGGSICGVVHFSDYNRPPVYHSLYQKLYLLERGLIHLIVSYSGLSKKSLEPYLEKKGKLNPDTLEEPLSNRDFRGKSLSLKGILKYVFRYELVKIRESDIKEIITLRNKIAHSDQLVASQSMTDSLNFAPNSFAKLIRGVNSLEVALRQVSNRLYLMEASLNDDFSKPMIPLEDFFQQGNA